MGNAGHISFMLSIIVCVTLATEDPCQPSVSASASPKQDLHFRLCNFWHLAPFAGALNFPGSGHLFNGTCSVQCAQY